VGGATAALATSKPAPVSEARSDSPDSAESEYQNGHHSYAEWPSHQEWQAAAQMEGMTLVQLEAEWDNQERKTPADRWKGIDRTRLRRHASFVLAKIRERTPASGGHGKAPPGVRGGSKAFAHEMQRKSELKKLN